MTWRAELNRVVTWRIKQAVRRWAPHCPSLALLIAELLGRAGSFARLVGPHPTEVESLLGCSRDVARSAVATIAATNLKSFVFGSLPHQTRCKLVNLVGGDLLREHRPAVVVFWHSIGPPHGGLSAALSKLDMPYQIAVRSLSGGGGPNLSPLGNAAARRDFLQIATETLRSGGLVVLAGDGHGSDKAVPLDLFGQTAHLPRGPAVLARVCGARVLPAVCQFRGLRVQVQIHPPIRASAERTRPDPRAEHGEGRRYGADRDTMIEIGRWFEAYLRSHPDQLRCANGMMRIRNSSRSLMPHLFESGRVADTEGTTGPA